MLISTKGRYALRLMLDLAIHTENHQRVSLKEIAGRQNISLKYLEQIISMLHKAGYVCSVRGPQGGYYLAMKPEEYTVGMILRLTEGDLAPVECLGNQAAPCDRQYGCMTLELWRQLQEAVNGVIDHMTLADLLARRQTDSEL